MRRLSRIRWEHVQRALIDAVGVNVALITAFLIRFSVLVWNDGRLEDFSSHAVLKDSIIGYSTAAPILTVMSLVIFALSGFYTHGRAYRGRYKALIVFQAVSLAYLVFGSFSYLFFDVTDWFPRPVWVMGWLLTLLLVGGMRLWAKLWRSTVWNELKYTGPPTRKGIKNVLVIGGAGYVGSVLVRQLLEESYNVTIMDSLIFGDEGIRSLREHPRVDVIQGDLRNIEAIIVALKYADAVVHLGGLVGDPACDVDEKLTVEVNLAATRLIAEAARGFGVRRFIFASSCSVYGASDEFLDERSTLDPVSLYARTKADSERVLLELTSEDFTPVILRFGTLYGLSPRPRFDLVVNLLTAKAVTEGSIQITGGDQWRPFVHVRDAARAVATSLKAPVQAVRGQIFNVGSDSENYTISQLGTMLLEKVPDLLILEKPGEGRTANYKVSCSKIKKHLGFVPLLTVADGIEEIRTAIEAGAVPYYQSERFNNHATLTRVAASGAGYAAPSLTPLYALPSQPVEALETPGGR